MKPPRYLLDTDIAVMIASGLDPTITERVLALQHDDWAISVVTRGELLAGLLEMPADHPAHDLVPRFLEVAPIREWDSGAAEAFSRLHHLKMETHAGIDGYGLMVAAHAVSFGATLATATHSALPRISPPLQFEVWTHETTWHRRP